MSKLLVLGAGSFARVVATTAKELGFEIAGFVVDDEFYKPHEMVMGKWVRSVSSLQHVPAGRAEDNPFVVGIMSPGRAGLYRQLAALNYKPWDVVAEGALSRYHGPELGCFVNAGVVVDVDVTFGRGVIVNRGATVGHDCVLGDFATVGPGAHLAGGVAVGAGATVGMGACVLEGRVVGAGAVVSACALVTRDVQPGTVVMGVPARLVRKA